MKSIALLFALTAGAFAATGTFGSYINVTTNGTAQWMNLSGQGGSSLSNFDGANLGTFDPSSGDTLTLSGAEILTWKNSGGDVTGGHIVYIIDGGTAVDQSVGWTADATFTDAAGISASGSGDQKWSDSTGWAPINILSGLSAGSHDIEVYMYASTNEGDRYQSNGGANYTATFTIVPETSSALLGALGALTLLRRRRA